MTLWLANHEDCSVYEGYFEIVSISGTLSAHGSQLQMAAAGQDGNTVDGHMVSGCQIYTTAEIVVAAFEEVVYKREDMGDPGYEELVVYPA